MSNRFLFVRRSREKGWVEGARPCEEGGVEEQEGGGDVGEEGGKH